jgi:hypothetical protein
VGVPDSTTTTTTVSPTADHTTTITKGVDANDNEITKKDIYREGVAGTSQNHTTTMTDPDGGTTTTTTRSRAPPNKSSRRRKVRNSPPCGVAGARRPPGARALARFEH